MVWGWFHADLRSQISNRTNRNWNLYAWVCVCLCACARIHSAVGARALTYVHSQFKSRLCGFAAGG